MKNSNDTTCVYIYICKDDYEVSGNAKRKKGEANFQVEFVDSQALKTFHC